MKLKVLLTCALCLACLTGKQVAGNLFAQGVKEPEFAAMYYPEDPGELSTMIEGFLASVNPPAPPGEIFALIAAHAGYNYSGQTAAYAYKLVKDKPYQTVIVIGSTHNYGFSGISVYPHGSFRTPLGDIEVDKDFAQKLLDKDENIYFSAGVFKKEHSVEVQLPFLQKVLTGWKIVPLVTGDCTLATCQKLAQLLKEAIGSRRDVLVVASSDMYHGYDYEEAENIDSSTLSALKNMDGEALYYGLREGKFQLCGGWGVVTALLLAKELGAEKLEVLQYTNSAQVSGNKTKGVWTVGYSSLVIAREEGEKPMLNKEQRKRLLEIARSSIETYFKTGKPPEIKESDPLLIQQMGAFVTLHNHGELRGCIGSYAGPQPLYQVVSDMGIEATSDPRFSPVQLTELGNIEIEISVLSQLKKVASADEIELGKHGVQVKKGFHQGVFLPQVATETGWSKEKFLSELCSQKAGLPPDAWKDKATELYVFTAEVFSEKED